jgi:hypothetical protein
MASASRLHRERVGSIPSSPTKFDGAYGVMVAPLIVDQTARDRNPLGSPVFSKG